MVIFVLIGAIKALVQKFEISQTHGIMDVFKIVYSQHWM